MYFYFSSSIPCALKLNGIYLGTIYKTVKFIAIESGASPLVELCPISNKTENCNFILNEDFIANPPDNLAVTDLKGGYLLHLKAFSTCSEFCLICQKKTDFALATLYNENGLKLTIETKNDFYIENFPFSVESASINFLMPNQNILYINFENKENSVAIYKLFNKIEKLFFDSNVKIISENPFKTQKQHFDIAKHTEIIEWEEKENTLIIKEKSVSTNSNFVLENLPDEILPYAFLEAYLVGENLEAYLSENLAKNVQKLALYLKNFIGIMPPPIFRNQNEIGLIYKKNKRLFEVLYITFELKDKKIINLKILDK